MRVNYGHAGKMSMDRGMSLVDRLAGAAGRRIVSPPGRGTAVLLAMAALMFAASIVVRLVAARSMAEADRLVEARSVAAPRLVRSARSARRLQGPTLDADLSAIAARLPPGTALVEMARDRAGLRIAIDTGDPDTLRAALAADPLLARFVPAGQAIRENGVIRASFVQAE